MQAWLLFRASRVGINATEVMTLVVDGSTDARLLINFAGI
jgi:hypothetical protein